MPLRFRPAAPASALLAFLALLAACDTDPGVGAEGTGIVAVLAGDPDFSQLNALVQGSPLAVTLASGGPYTLFAPDDVAFVYLGSDTRDALVDPANDAVLERVLRYHVVPGLYAAEDLTDGLVLETLDGTPLPVRREGASIFVGEARVTDDAIGADNGVVYPISTVLRGNLTLGERLALTPIAGDFARLTASAGLGAELDADGERTVFVAVDDAFDQLGGPALSLLYAPLNADVLGVIAESHIVEGEVLLAALPDGAEVETRSGLALTVTADDGVYYVDGHRVLSPPVQATNGVFYLVERLFLEGLSLEQRLRISPSLSGFNNWLDGFPDLQARLGGDAPYTVFAFTNTAYNSLNDAVVNAIGFEANTALRRALVEVHLVPGVYREDDLTDGLTLQSVEGKPLRVVRRDGALFIENRPLVLADLDARNGVLHHLDGVIYPDTDVFDTALLNGLTEYVRAVRAAGLEDLLRERDPLTVFGFVNAYFAQNPDLLFRPDLRDILLYHATGEALPQVTEGQEITPLTGPQRTIYYVNLGGSNTPALDSVIAVGLVAPATNGYVYFADGDTLTVPFAPRR